MKIVKLAYHKVSAEAVRLKRFVGIDRIIKTQATSKVVGDNTIFLIKPQSSLIDQRLKFLSTIGLCKAEGSTYLLNATWESELRASNQRPEVIYVFHRSEVFQYLGVSLNNASQFEDAIDRVQKRGIKIRTASGAWISYSSWLPRVGYFPEQNTIEFELVPDLMDYYLVYEQFTQIPLRTAFDLRSKYSFRFYELFLQWQSQIKRYGYHEIEISVSDIRTLFILSDELETKTITRDIVKKSVEEINLRIPTLQVTMSTRKHGKPVYSYVFRVSTKKNDHTLQQEFEFFDDDDPEFIKIFSALKDRYDNEPLHRDRKMHLGFVRAKAYEEYIKIHR